MQFDVCIIQQFRKFADREHQNVTQMDAKVSGRHRQRENWRLHPEQRRQDSRPRANHRHSYSPSKKHRIRIPGVHRYCCIMKISFFFVFGGKYRDSVRLYAFNIDQLFESDVSWQYKQKHTACPA